MSGLLQGELTVEYTNDLGIMSRWGLGGRGLCECVSSVFLVGWRHC